MDYNYLVPVDTQKRTHAIEQCENLALILGRYIPQEVIRNDPKEDIFLKSNGKFDETKRSRWLRNTLEHFMGKFVRDICDAHKKRWLAMTEQSARFQLELRGRMVVGLGGKNPLEFGITLDKLTGLPYIPGSALKGLARSYALLTIYADAKNRGIEEPLDKFEEKIIQGEYQSELSVQHFYDAFGTTENAGGCIFYDAILSLKKADDEQPIFVVDVMTPHFGAYYTDTSHRTAPDDSLSPTPILYISVREGLRFAFAVGMRRGFKNVDACEQAIKWLQGGLAEMGIGAKTAQGYGVFKDIRGDNS